MYRNWSDLVYGTSNNEPIDHKIVVSPLKKDNDVQNFINIHHQTSTGVIPLLDDKTFARLEKLKTLMARLYIPELNECIAIIIIVILPVRVNNHIFNYGITAYFSVRASYRGRGYGMTLLNHIKEHALNNGVHAGYHIIPLKRGPSVKIKQWYYALNNNLDHLGFYQSTYRFKSIVHNIKVFRITKHNYKICHRYWKLYNMQSNFAYWPSQSEYLAFISAIPSYSIIIDGILIGMFSYELNMLIMSDTHVNAALLQLLAIKENKFMEVAIFSVIETLKRSYEQIDVLYGYKWGLLYNTNIFNNSDVNLYLCMYPSLGIPDLANVSIPIF